MQWIKSIYKSSVSVEIKDMQCQLMRYHYPLIKLAKIFLEISVSVRTREQEFSCAAGGNENPYHLPEGQYAA